MLGEGLEHVIEETDGGRDVEPAFPVQVQCRLNIGFLCFPRPASFTDHRKTSTKALTLAITRQAPTARSRLFWDTASPAGLTIPTGRNPAWRAGLISSTVSPTYQPLVLPRILKAKKMPAGSGLPLPGGTSSMVTT